MENKEKTERRAKLEKLHRDFFAELQATGFGFYAELRGWINPYSIHIGIEDVKDRENIFSYSFGSEISVSVHIDNLDPTQEAYISVGGNGCFSPSNLSPYWRIKHASIILDNWDVVQEICQRYCASYQNEFQG